MRIKVESRRRAAPEVCQESSKNDRSHRLRPSNSERFPTPALPSRVLQVAPFSEYIGGTRSVSVNGDPVASARSKSASDVGTRPLAQHEFLNLAGRGRGQRSEHDRLRCLEMRKLITTEGDDLISCRGRSGLELDEGAWRLA